MRELTEKEKNLCKALVEKDEQEQHQLRVGDVLHDLIGFECIEKDKLGEEYPDSPFKIRLTCISSQREDIVDDLNEAISLLLMLKDKGMISFVDSKSDECFGDNTSKMYGLQEPTHSDAAVIDYFDINTWQLLNSYYYISNSFKDYCKNFKSIEQRRYEKTIIVALLTLLITTASLIVSIRSCCQAKATSYSEENTKEIIFQQPSIELVGTSCYDTISNPVSSDSIINTKHTIIP